jgi:hypothetical protein
MKTNLPVAHVVKIFRTIFLLTLFACPALAAAKNSAAKPSPPAGALRDFKLVGELAGDQVTFTLTATAVVENSKGGSIELISGKVALIDVGPHPKWTLRAERDRYLAVFERDGKFPVSLKFTAAVSQDGAGRAVDFRVAPAVLQPVLLRGFDTETKFEFAGSARLERRNGDFASFLPPDGAVKFSWQKARKTEEGKLFYAAEMRAQISISPGLMRQVALLDFKVMQGELSRLALALQGTGEITRVSGDHLLAWRVEPATSSTNRRLIVQLNEPQKTNFALQVQAQTPLGTFPQNVEAIRLGPEGATRFAGHIRVVNEGSVRLEITRASGLSQISPVQFPESDASRTVLAPTGAQRFAYRFSGADYSLAIQADQIQPELAVSEVLLYHHGQNDLVIEGEFEVDIREAPLRELQFRVPKGYALARVNAAGLSDYFLRELPEEPDAELRLVYGQAVSGRQIVQLRLERNKPLEDTTWTLPRIEVARAKSSRGNVGVSADAGFRLTPDRTQALTEITTAFFPRKLEGLQAAFRLNEPAWQASLRVVRLPQSVQTDALHLFSIGEGIAYGSSVLNYVISGAPVSVFKIELSDEYFNVEFAGKDIRNWQKTTNGYLVQLHSAVSGSYTLLATFERPFKSQGDTLTFTGARPLDAQSEQGHVIVTSDYQFQVKPAEISTGLLPLETGEVPPEYRLFFDTPVLAAYRYTLRPFNLRLGLNSLAQGDSLNQVVDRASLITRISKEGQAVTDATYLVKSRGNPGFRLTLPAGSELWSATVNGAAVVPVQDGKAHLIPLPQRADPNAVVRVEVKLAAKTSGSSHLAVASPVLNAPVMFAEWKLDSDTGRRLIYQRGSLTPANGVVDLSGFAQLTRAFSADPGRVAAFALAGFLMVICAAEILRRIRRDRVERLGPAYVFAFAIEFAAILFVLIQLGTLFNRHAAVAPANLTFVAPVQQAGSALAIELANLPDEISLGERVSYLWPALVALAIWILGSRTVSSAGRVAREVLAWTLLGWAALRCPNGAPAFVVVTGAFVVMHFVLPVLRRTRISPPAPVEGGTGAARAATTLLLGGLLWLSCGSVWAAQSARERLAPAARLEEKPAPALPTVVADSIAQQIRVEEKFALAAVAIKWKAEKNEVLPVLFEPAVLTRIRYPSNALQLVQAETGSRRTEQLLAQKSGVFEIQLEYQLRIEKRDSESELTLPTPAALVNQLDLTVVNLDVDIRSPQAVSIRREIASSNTVAALVLSPSAGARIFWKARSRDVTREREVFYADISQLYVPAAGVIEGAHLVAIRPAQGEVSELSFTVPREATITDVVNGAARGGQTSVPGLVASWRFDPDLRKLLVTLNPPQSRPFALLVRSQIATGPLPIEKTVGLLNVDNAADQIGLLGIATGADVQLDGAAADDFVPINLEDFPAAAFAQIFAAQTPGLTVRRAFRYADTRATASLKASAVEPDVRVEIQNTISLGEDRTVLAANANVEITRAGIFRLSFLLPQGYDVESISGAALSHWTELRNGGSRIITLNLLGKSEGRQAFAVNLIGPGAKATNGWVAPQVVFREASKQQGSLLIVPEQGLQLQATTLNGISQLDPQRAGIRQKGVLAFRLLQPAWTLGLTIEQVDPWIQVTSLQHAVISDAQIKVAANLQYQIESAGVKTLRVYVPSNAASVRLQGEQVSDFLQVAERATNGLTLWEAKLQRRILGPALLQLTYQIPIADRASEIVLHGVQAADVNLQRGFVTIEGVGRLQVRVERVPPTLQSTEWQSIPAALQQNLQTAPANFAYRLVEPAFRLPVKLDRHEAAKVLQARVREVKFTSVISDEGVMLTLVRLELFPGDKRLLYLTLPSDATFWFALVNQNGVWPWKEKERILIPLEASSRDGKPLPVEIFYSSRIGQPSGRALDLALQGPKFDLPLEEITWRIFLNEKWQVKNWTGTLQLLREEMVSATSVSDPTWAEYLRREADQQREKTHEAEQMLALGNTALERGDPQEARRAFQSAFGLSTHDNAFNEDARVQLHNIKLQQALIGLNVRQAVAGGDATALGGRFRDLRNLKEVRYTQQDARQIIDRNSADDNSAYLRLAEKLIQQQDAAMVNASAIRASIPEEGRLLTFRRSVAVEREADLRIGLHATAVEAASRVARILILAAVGLTLAFLCWRAGGLRRAA